MTRIILVHGIHTSVDDPVVKALIPYLSRGFEVVYPDYGWIAGLETRIANPLLVAAMLPFIKPYDVFVGHSNGCAIGYDLMNRGARFDGAVFINPALEQHIVRPPQVRWIDVYFNSGDEITRAAAVAEELHIVDKVWGEMGHAGYDGSDPNILNIKCDNVRGLPPVSGHSDIFKKLDQGWGDYIFDRICKRLS